MFIFTVAIIFIFGLIIGSFINALVYRLESGDSIVRGRSKCPHCQRQLKAGDLIPVLSFFLLLGRCRYCRGKISWQYPIVELLTALLFVVAFCCHGYSWLLLARDFIAIAALVAIFVSDFLYMTIPDEVALPALVAIFLLNYAAGFSVFPLVMAAAIGGGFFGLQFLLSRGKWIGGGDLRLGVLMGVLLGWPGILLALFFAYIFGAIIASVLLLLKKVTPKTQMPFGVFLAPATLVVMFFGESIINWYLNLL